MTFFLGIDGGGTKTRCVLGDESSVLATGSGAGCSILRVGEAGARDSLAGAIHEACVQAGVSPQQISKTCIGAAGAGDATIAATVKRLLSSLVGGEIEVVGDMEVALESAFGAGPGVVVVAGTGSIACGRNAKGETARAGGWGRILCDEGSAHWIAVKAMDVTLHAFDRGENPALLADLMRALDLKSPTDLSVYAGGSPTPEFAPLFPVVLSAARAGDAIARRVLQRAGAELAGLAETVITRRFDGEQVRVATHGGVFAGSPQVKQAFEQGLRELCAQAELVDKVVDPAAGALARARQQLPR